MSSTLTLRGYSIVEGSYFFLDLRRRGFRKAFTFSRSGSASTNFSPKTVICLSPPPAADRYLLPAAFITATAGDSLVLRMGTQGFVPEIRLFGPDGALVGDAFTVNGNNRDAQLFLQATNSGLYTVVVGSYFLNNSGTYNLTLAQVPKLFVTLPTDDGGTLTNGVSQAGTIASQSKADMA